MSPSVPVDELAFADIVNVAQRFSEKSVCTQNRYMDSLHAILRFGIAQGLTVKHPLWRPFLPAYLTFRCFQEFCRVCEHPPLAFSWRKTYLKQDGTG